MVDMGAGEELDLKPRGSGLNPMEKEEFLEWLLMTPDERDEAGVPTQKDFAAKLRVDPRRLSRLRREPEFLARWNEEFLATVGNPGRLSEQMEVLHITATDPDDPAHVRAAQAYASIVDKLRPPPPKAEPQPQKVEVTIERRPPAELSDAELAAMQAKIAEDELAKRREERAG